MTAKRVFPAKTNTAKKGDSAPSFWNAPCRVHKASSGDQIRLLHQTLGNQAVGRLILQSRVGCRESEIIQAKLTINKPNEIYEQEADRVAGQLMRILDKGDDGNRLDSASRISQYEIGNPQSAIQLKPG